MVRHHGAKVRATVDDSAVLPWTSFVVPRESTLTVSEVKEGLRFYIGFSGTPAIDPVMGSYTTNLECRFGGFKGRPLMKGDCLEFNDVKSWHARGLPAKRIPEMNPPHL